MFSALISPPTRSSSSKPATLSCLATQLAYAPRCSRLPTVWHERSLIISLFLIDCLQGDDGSVTTEVVATARRTFELSRVGSAAGGHARAFLDTRREQQHLSGADMPMHAEHCRSEEWVSMDELLEHVPASSAEIISELRESGAVQLDNNMWWMPPPGHFSEMVDIALPAIRAQGDDLSSADATALEETLEREDGYRRDVVRAFMRQHSMKNDDGTLAIDLRSVARLKARHLLPADSKPIKLEDFMERWRNACPENSADYVCTELLECLAIVEQDKHGQSVVVPLAEESLPLQPKALFAKLFEARKRCAAASIPSMSGKCDLTWV